MDLEHKLSDEDWPCDVLIGQLKVLCQLGIVDKLPLKKPPASAVEDVSPRREKAIEGVAHLSDYGSTKVLVRTENTCMRWLRTCWGQVPNLRQSARNVEGML